MNGFMRRLGPQQRLAMSVAIIGLAHVALLRFGNEDATPLRLLGSFVLSSTLLVAAHRIRQHLTTSAESPPTLPRSGDRNVS